MSNPNPYAPPAPPQKPLLPGVKYRIDPRRYELTEAIQMKRSVLKGCWNWLLWQLGFTGDALLIMTVPKVPEETAELADMPAGVAEYFLIFEEQARQLGFYGRWTAMTLDDNANPLCCVLRMLSHDPRYYLEIVFLAVGKKYISRHSLVSATTRGEYVATSNGFPYGRRPSTSKPLYLPDAPFEMVLAKHRARLPAQTQGFREYTTIEQIMATVQEMLDGNLRFNIERGLMTPLDPGVRIGE